MHKMLVMSAVVAGLLLSPMARADLVDEFPSGFFGCLPESIRDLTYVRSRGTRWADGKDQTSNSVAWGVTTYTAVGVESGLTYTVKARSVGMQFFDIGYADQEYVSVEGEFPSDFITGATMWHFQHPGEPSPNGGWVLERVYSRARDGDLATDDTDVRLAAVFCYERNS